MNNDLISREALLIDLSQDREEGTFEFSEDQAAAAGVIIRYIYDRIMAQPAVSADPGLPRALTLEEVKSLPYGHTLIETNKKEPTRWLDALLFCKNTNFSFDFITMEGRVRLLGVEYNKEWRCWTSRPTDEQREEEPWSC